MARVVGHLAMLDWRDLHSDKQIGTCPNINMGHNPISFENLAPQFSTYAKISMGPLKVDGTTKISMGPLKVDGTAK